MKKKLLSYLLCAVMVFSLAACGDDSGNQGDTQQDSQQEQNDQQGDNQQDDSQQGDDQQDDSQQGDDQQDDGQQGDDQQEEAAVGPMALRVEAESYEQGDGVGVEGDHLGGLNTKAWAMYNVDLADGGYKQISIRYGADSIGGVVRLWIGDEDYEEFGSMIGEADFAGTGSWDMNSTVTFDVSGLSGQSGLTSLVLEWESPEGESDYLMNPDWFELYKVNGAGSKNYSYNFFDNDFSGNEWAGYRGDEPNYTHIYVGGGCYTGYKVDFGEGGYTDLYLIGDFLNECEIEVHLDSPDGQLVDTVSFTGNADWNDSIIQTNGVTVSVSGLASVTGIHGVYFVFNGGDYNFAAFRFLTPANKLSARLEAESVLEYTTSIDLQDNGNSSGDHNVGGTQGGKYDVYRLDFEDGGYNKVLIRYGTITVGGVIELRYGDPNGELITTIELKAEDAPDTKAENFGSDWTAWADYEIDVPDLAGLTGEQIICFVFQPTDGADSWVGNFDYYEFSK